MRLDLIWWPINNVHTAAVRSPSLNAGGIMLIGVRDAAVVFVFELVVFAVRIGIAPLPERLDKLVALFVVRELHESFALFVADDPAHVFVEPLAVLAAQL